MALIAGGHVPISALVTLHCGEYVHDPVAGTLTPLKDEVIKICGTGEASRPWHCVFHTETGCAIYAHRPAQCRALFCEDTDALAALYITGRARRADVMAHAPHTTEGWSAIMAAHAERCALPIVDRLSQEDRAEAVRFDNIFRKLCIERAAIDAQHLPFLLGRPLS